jgi:hypothetical protein
VACFRLRLGGGVSLRLPSARRFPRLSASLSPLAGPLTEAFFKHQSLYDKGGMTLLNDISVVQLRKAVAIKEKIERLESKFTAIFEEATTPQIAVKQRRRMSAAGRARMAVAARARWAKIKGTQATPTKKRRKMSGEGRARISAAAKARWRKAKAAGKNTL